MHKSLVIILYDHPLEHTADYATQTAKVLSRANTVYCVLLNDVLSIKEMFHNPKLWWIQKKERSIGVVIKPFYLIPFRRFASVRKLNNFLIVCMLRLYFYVNNLSIKPSKKIVWYFSPHHYATFGSNYFHVYDCVDYHSMDEVHKNALCVSDLVCVNSQILFTYLKKYRSDVKVVPFGFDKQNFSQHIAKTSPKDATIVVGYVGGLNSRIHFSLLLALIRRNPTWLFVFVGPIQQHEDDESHKKVVVNIYKMLHCTNVRHNSMVSKEKIASEIQKFTIGIIPYDTSLPFNKYSFPMKTFEYLYMGKPVVATPMYELQQYRKYLYIANSVSQWEKYIRLSSKSSVSQNHTARVRRFIQSQSWERKVQSIVSQIY